MFPNFADLLAQGAANAWIFVPTAILLGALHGLEPGHSKTLMAAFIVAIRGTVFQAFLLGIAATISHTLVVWAIAIGGMYIWQGLNPDRAEVWLQFISGLIIIAVGLWMFWRIRQDNMEAAKVHAETSAFDVANAGNALSKRIDTGHGHVVLEVAGAGADARWRMKSLGHDQWQGEYVTVVTERANGDKQTFTFLDRDGYIESAEPVPAPYDFNARLIFDHGDHAHEQSAAFGAAANRFAAMESDAMDAHARGHMEDIKRRFANQPGGVTNGQIILFGLTGGLIPCPAAITVLLLCLQVKEITLGAVLVLCFSIGLAITLVAVGAVAALGVGRVAAKTNWFSVLAARAPYYSSGLGIYMAIHGLTGVTATKTAGLPAPAAHATAIR
jgi:nickel/cobalt transporter (NicO) family protein